MNTAPILIRYHQPGTGARLGILRDGGLYDISHCFPTLADFFRDSVGDVAGLIAAASRAADDAGRGLDAAALDNPPSEDVLHYLPTLDKQEVWAAGVTYIRSREARQEESSDGGDVYARVYDAPRPEIFYKASAKNTVGHRGEVGIRSDSQWNVPEPELGLAFNADMQLLGFTIGNDMSSRDIEGANPLYLPQAKVYTASCALGPGILLAPSEDWLETTISLSISRAGNQVFQGSIGTDQIKRSINELADYLGRSNSYAHGVFLLTGTGIVPPADFTLLAGDEVAIAIDGIGSLQNRVIEV